ncbi:MAG: hypothetical protein ACI9YE_002796 [Psychroserpens sp.]|jgi:hypothetical protein
MDFVKNKARLFSLPYPDTGKTISPKFQIIDPESQSVIHPDIFETFFEVDEQCKLML